MMHIDRQTDRQTDRYRLEIKIRDRYRLEIDID